MAAGKRVTSAGEEQRRQEADERVRAEFRTVEAELDRRWPESTIEPSLERISALVDLLGDPQRACPVVHLAGTNGKTSTARMVDALLTEAGLRTGRYTSPHLQLATERISLDGGPIGMRRYVEVYREVEPYVRLVDERPGGGPAMSKFEVLTAMAFAAFADAPVEVAVLETGLGGRWDATNVADGTVSVITPIGVDHVEYLGGDISEIAGEKAGIIKPGSIAVLAAQDAEVAAVLMERCAEVGATVARQGMEFGVLRRTKAVGGQLLKLQGLGGAYDDVFLPLHGEHQAGNAAVALAAAEALIGAGADHQLDADAVRAAFARVAAPGRLERV
ncbi:MAG: dihydrofolate synthase, partial [Pseudonocardia sp.]|nr:dihydrofolate synthase [Pseudonocardia sp.]